MSVAQENSFYKCIIDIDDLILDSEKVFEVSDACSVNLCWYQVIVQKVLLLVIVAIVQEWYYWWKNAEMLEDVGKKMWSI